MNQAQNQAQAPVIDPAEYELRTRRVNGLFGIQVSRNNTGAITNSNLNARSENLITDYVLRESGLERQIQKNRILAAALQSPSVYLMKKNKNLDDIGESLAIYFSQEYQRLLKTGITEEKARKKATEFMNAQKEREMVIHNENFPTEVNDKVAEKLLRTN